MARNLFPLHKSTVCADCVLTYNAHNITRLLLRVNVNFCVLGAGPESLSSGFATSLAAVLGILARRPTLLVDFSNKPHLTRKALGINGVRGTEALVDQYIRTRDLTDDDVRQQIVSYVIPAETNLGGRGFDLLVGPVKYTPQYEDRLAAQRGVGFAELLVDRLAELAYEYVVVDIGDTLDTLRGLTVAHRAELLVVVYEDEALLKKWARGKEIVKRLRKVQIATCESRAEFAFPDEHFVASLVSSSQYYETATARFALEWAEILRPSIAAELTDSQNNRLQPYRTWLQTLDKVLGG
jgi:hypothetical protein